MSTPAVTGVPDLPFLDGRPKKLLIAGEWVEAASGTTFPSVNPSTGQVIAEVAEGGAEDADRAVAAARQASSGSPEQVSTRAFARSVRSAICGLPQ